MLTYFWCRRAGRVQVSVPVLLMVMCAGAGAQESAAPSSRPMRQISSVDGKDLYAEYCALCHGPRGKGDGPRAKDLSKPVPDLTTIAQRNGGKFNRTKISRFISGEDRPGSSPQIDPKSGRTVIMTKDGPDPMPVWQSVFRRMWPDQMPQLRIGNIVRYIEQLQIKE
jgi:mono/diheme cytochrome c family protein